MSGKTIVVVTGANRGIGNALATAYLARENHTVVGTVRDKEGTGAAELKSAPLATGSELFLVEYDSLKEHDAEGLVEKMEAVGLNHVDILIPCAAISPDIKPMEETDRETFLEAFNVNALGPLFLYRACSKLLRNAQKPIFAPITSAAGTIGGMEQGKSHVAAAYAISKAALNWVTLAAHCTQEWLISIPINPGLVATEMGNRAAEQLKMQKDPMAPEQSAEKIMERIDASSREKYSGQFLNAPDGIVFPW